MDGNKVLGGKKAAQLRGTVLRVSILQASEILPASIPTDSPLGFRQLGLEGVAIKSASRGSRGGLEFKSTGCSSKGPEFKSQKLHGGS